MPAARPGDGTRLSVNFFGSVYSAPDQGATFDHPWKPALGARQLRFTVATVSGNDVIIPAIKLGGQLVPMNGGKSGGAPALLLDPGQVNDDGVSFAVLEVEPDAKGELTKDARVEIVHRSSGAVSHGPIGRKAVTMILWQDGRPLRALPLVHFNFVYERVKHASGAVDHIFR